jgi:predicted RNA-binding Zn-ribbon protein involved in translation (DUF1610 family)
MNKIKNHQCDNCGATLKFNSGASSLSCEYCGKVNQRPELAGQAVEIKEFDMEQTLLESFNKETEIEITTVQCESCSAETTLGDKLSSKECPFCSAPLVIKQTKIQRMHKPHYLLPFKVSEKQAMDSFQSWIKSLWFAPNSLTKQAKINKKLQGIFIPFWTYDCATLSKYDGKRGTNYTDRDNNKSVTRTHWVAVNGSVECAFNDLLIAATKSLPTQLLDRLEPWDLEQLEGYQNQYLTGFKTENYQITLRQAYLLAKDKMSLQINQYIKMDMGGDKQIINHFQTQYKDETFKHILLPCWVSAYRFNNKTYQFVVNARTAKVQSERPYSWVKIISTLFISVSTVFMVFSTDWPAVFAKLGLFFQ